MASHSCSEANHYRLSPDLLSFRTSQSRCPDLVWGSESYLTSPPSVGHGPMATAEPIIPPRSAWQPRRDRRLRDSPSEEACGSLLLSPPLRTINTMTGPVMTALPAQVNRARYPTQTLQYAKPGAQSFENLHTFQTPNNLQASFPFQASTMDPTGNGSYSGGGFKQTEANPYLDERQSIQTSDESYNGLPAQAFFQQPSPAMSRDSSLGNGFDHMGFSTSSMTSGHFDLVAMQTNRVYGANLSHSSSASAGHGSAENDAGELPYATLIFQALMSSENKRMVLKDIYKWFEQNTEKAKDPHSRGWQNSIRHNLSMNGVSDGQPPSSFESDRDCFSDSEPSTQAFQKVDHPASEDGKKCYVWVLDPGAEKAGGVESTTRFRKGPTASRGVPRFEGGTTRRQRAGARGGRASSTLRHRRCPAERGVSMTPSMTPSTMRQPGSSSSSPVLPSPRSDPSLISAQTTKAWDYVEPKVEGQWSEQPGGSHTGYGQADLPTPISDGFDHEYQLPMHPGSHPNPLSPAFWQNHQRTFDVGDIVGSSGMMNQPSLGSQAYDYEEGAPIYGAAHGLNFNPFP